MLCSHRIKACDAITFGSLLRGLDLVKIDPNMNPESIYVPLKTLAERISGLEIHVHPKVQASSYPYTSFDHTKCYSSDIKKEVEAVMASIEDPVLESHYRHMAAQKAKLN